MRCTTWRLPTTRPAGEDEALKLREEALALHRKASGPEHPDTLRAMTTLADSYGALGRGREAVAILEKAV